MAKKTKRKLTEACWALRLVPGRKSNQPAWFHSGRVWDVVQLFPTRKDAYEYRDGLMYDKAYTERLTVVPVDVTERG